MKFFEELYLLCPETDVAPPLDHKENERFTQNIYIPSHVNYLKKVVMMPPEIRMKHSSAVSTSWQFLKDRLGKEVWAKFTGREDLKAALALFLAGKDL